MCEPSGRAPGQCRLPVGVNPSSPPVNTAAKFCRLGGPARPLCLSQAAVGGVSTNITAPITGPTFQCPRSATLSRLRHSVPAPTLCPYFATLPPLRNSVPTPTLCHLHVSIAPSVATPCRHAAVGPHSLTSLTLGEQQSGPRPVAVRPQTSSSPTPDQ